MKYKFNEIFDIPALTRFCESFTRINGTVTALLDLEGNVHISTGWQDICTKFHRVCAGTAQRCTESDTVLAGQLESGKSYNVYKCKNGLVDVAVPVIVDGDHVGNFFTGQFLFEKPDIAYFTEQARLFGFDQQAYLEALERVPIFSEEEVRKIMDFLVEMTQTIGEMGINKLNELKTKEKLERSQKELEKREAYIRLLFNSSPIGLALCDLSGELVDVNPAYARILGHSEEELKRLTYWDITPKKYATQEQEQLDMLASKGRYGPYEKEYTHRDGYLIPVRLSGRMIELEGQQYIFSSVEDISQQKEIENARREQYRSESANKAKSEFLATMSHEIRTPLNAILGMTELLQETELSKAQQWQVDTLANSGKALLSLINDILDLSKIESGRLKLELIAFDLQKLIDELQGIFSYKASDKGVGFAARIDADIPKWLESDPTRIRQILFNLINNAIKFTDSGAVDVHVEAGSGSEIRFNVSDTGHGIPQEKQEQIFEAFTQQDSSISRKHGGTGLGLTICRRLADLLGGRIVLESSVGQGSTFTLMLPLQEAALPTEAEVSASGFAGSQRKRAKTGRRELSKLRILLAEDTEENQMVIKAFLARSGCHIDIADNGAIAAR